LGIVGSRPPSPQHEDTEEPQQDAIESVPSSQLAKVSKKEGGVRSAQSLGDPLTGRALG
jgi:hypothetical protein